jgi:hypothetical protein
MHIPNLSISFRGWGLYLLYLTFYLFPGTDVSGQIVNRKFEVYGQLKDTLEYTPVDGASVSVFGRKEHIPIASTHSDPNGNIALVLFDTGKYEIKISHFLYGDKSHSIQIRDSTLLLGIIYLEPIVNTLEEVVISHVEPMVKRGDTIEFTGDSFLTRKYDDLEELLKKLYGLEISTTGKITAMGKEVEKVTVDGETFFSDDPALVIKMLRASAVDKVQVFDDKGDMGSRNNTINLKKTINIKLKKESKKGAFGKAGISASPNNYWENSITLNSFRDKEKMAVFGQMSNLRQSASFNNQLAGSGSWGSGNREVISNGNNHIGTILSYQQGLPKNWGGGALYNNKFLRGSLGVNFEYRSTKDIMEILKTEKTHYLLPDSQYFSSSSDSGNRISDNHRINVGITYDIDSSSSIRLGYKAFSSKVSWQGRNHIKAYFDPEHYINENINTESGKSADINHTVDVLYKWRPIKKGVTFSAYGYFRKIHNSGSNTIASDLRLYSADSIYMINRRRANGNKALLANVDLFFSKQISKSLDMELKYRFINNHNESELLSYNREMTQEELKRETLDSAYSSFYRYDLVQNDLSISFIKRVNDLSFSLGGKISRVGLSQEDQLLSNQFSQAYLNFLPTFDFMYNLTSSNITFAYSTFARQPTISQTQPIDDNTNSLDVIIGNPNLKQEVTHNFSLDYNYFDLKKKLTVFLNSAVDLHQNKITLDQSIDLAGRRVSQFLNTQGNFNLRLNGGTSLKLAKGLKSTVAINVNYSQNTLRLNGIAEKNNQFFLAPHISMDFNKDTTLNWRYSVSPVYQRSISGVSSNHPNHFWSFNQNFYGSLTLKFNIEIGASIMWNIRRKIDQEDQNNNIVVFSPFVSKRFLKDRSLTAKLYGNDLLNQNNGFYRNVGVYTVTEGISSVITRYVMLSLTWNFTKTY